MKAKDTELSFERIQEIDEKNAQSNFTDALVDVSREQAEISFKAGIKEVMPFVDKLFEALSHADFSNGVEAFGVDEGRIRGFEFVKNIEEEWQAKLKEWGIE